MVGPSLLRKQHPCKLAFERWCWRQALAAAREAIGKLEAGGQKWHRPPDYYAEMVKSDEHMARVKQQLMHEQAEIAGAEERCDWAVMLIGFPYARGEKYVDPVSGRVSCMGQPWQGAQAGCAAALRLEAVCMAV